MPRSAPARATLYGDDLAYIHHAGFHAFSLNAAPHLLACLREANIDRGLVADLGCGSGLWLRELLGAGYTALGVDASPSMIKLARLTAPKAMLCVSSAHTVALPPCAAVTAIGEGLGYLPANARTSRSLAPLFGRVARALRPGGLFIFDMVVDGRGPRLDYRAFRTGADWAVFVDVREDRHRARLVREMVTFRRVGAGYRRGHERHVVQLHTRATITGALRAAGFTVRVSDSYGKLALAPRRLAFSARKV